MGCKACERRRKALAEKRRKKQEQGKQFHAAAIGAALAVTEVVGKAIGIHGEVGDERRENPEGGP